MAYLAFDADGVLVNSRDLAWKTAAAIRSMFDGPHVIESANDADALFSASAQKVLVGGHASTLRMMHRLVMRHHASTLPLFDEVLTVIGDVDARRVVVTAALASGISTALGPHANLFEKITGFETGRKPDLMFELAMCGQPVIYTTDSVSDVEMCVLLAIPCVAVTWGYDARSSLEAAGASAVVDTPHELKKQLEIFLMLNRK